MLHEFRFQLDEDRKVKVIKRNKTMQENQEYSEVGIKTFPTRCKSKFRRKVVFDGLRLGGQFLWAMSLSTGLSRQ